jgi:hypothetical protein
VGECVVSCFYAAVAVVAEGDKVFGVVGATCFAAEDVVCGESVVAVAEDALVVVAL